MARYEVVIKDTHEGKEEAFEAESVILMTEDGKEKMQLIDRQANMAMRIAILCESEDWKKAREFAVGYEKHMRKKALKAKIKRDFGFGGDGD